MAISMVDDRRDPPDPVSDEEFLRRLSSGDRSALDLIIQQYWSPLIQYTGRLLGSWDAAEDVTQCVFLRVWKRRQHLTPEGNMRAFLFRIARNLALDELRRDGRAQNRPAGGAAARVFRPDEYLEARQLSDAFTAAVLALPERRREVFLLVRLQEMSYEEVGQVMGISPQTVANQFSAALASLRATLQDDQILPDAGARKSARPLF